MKIYLKRVLCVLVTICLTILSIQYWGMRLDPKFITHAYRQIEAFYSQPENSIDVIIYGSSHAWKGVKTDVMRDKYGIKAYNYACNWQQLNTTQLFLKDSLYTQDPKLVLIETYHPEILSDCDMNGEIYYTRYLKNTPEKRAYLNQCFAGDWGRYVSYYIPLIAFHESWETVDKENYIPLDSDQNEFLKTYGFKGSQKITEAVIGNDSTFEKKNFTKETLFVLDDIVQTCHERNIDIIFFTIPFEGTYAYFDAFEKYAKQNQCVYLNLFHMDGKNKIDPLNDFQDITHLNSNGAEKVADYLGNYIVQYYDLNK